MSTWKELKTELLQNPQVVHQYHSLEPQASVIRQIIKARISQRLTQQQLADKMNVKQSLIARLESGTTNPTLQTLQKVSQALERRLTITID